MCYHVCGQVNFLEKLWINFNNSVMRGTNQKQKRAVDMREEKTEAGRERERERERSGEKKNT